jgi:glycosyltransferase involved in cell wall biosynthesis
MSDLHVVVPNDIDDPTTPTGGNVYDRRICTALGRLGWTVREHPAYGRWPEPDPADRAALARLVAALPDGATVLIDGLVASCVPDVLIPAATRLRPAVLVHMPLGDEAPERRCAERAVLDAASAVITTSHWCRGRLIDLYGLGSERVHAAAPGVDPAPLVPSSRDGSRLLCVGAVSAHKGHDLLIAALEALADLPVSCVLVGSLERDPDFVATMRERVQGYGLGERVRFAGPRTGRDLEAAYAAADLLVLPSRGETYGMVVTEALAHGIPVVGTAVKGLPESLGYTPEGERPGLLVPPEDAPVLAGALRRWLTEPALRKRLTRLAAVRRTTLTGWPVTAKLISNALSRQLETIR